MLQNSHGEVKYSLGNTVNNIVITVWCWVLEIECFKNLFSIFPFHSFLVILWALCEHSIIFFHFQSPQLLNFPSFTLTYFPLMSTPVSFVQWITHIFSKFCSTEVSCLIFSISGTLLGLNGKNEAAHSTHLAAVESC